MSVRIWIAITQEQFDRYRCDWPENFLQKKSYWERLFFRNDDAWVNKWLTQEEALAEAEDFFKEGFDGQLVICGVDIDDETCIQALNQNTRDHGNFSNFSYYGICKEFIWLPNKLPKAVSAAGFKNGKRTINCPYKLF